MAREVTKTGSWRKGATHTYGKSGLFWWFWWWRRAALQRRRPTYLSRPLCPWHPLRLGSSTTSRELCVASTSASVAKDRGFAILALAPMPMFASYGLLAAVMIAMALAASLLVLPSLLMLVTSDQDKFNA